MDTAITVRPSPASELTLAGVRRPLCRILLWLISIVGTSSALAGLEITQVTLDKTQLSAPDDEVRVRYQLSEPAEVVLRIFNPFDQAVYTASSEGNLEAGSHDFVWDGRDDRGRLVSSDAYVYTLSAHNDAASVIFDLSDITGGETVAVENIDYDREAGQVTYSIDKSGRFYLRVGIENGFVLKTLVNNEVRIAGRHSLAWDGADQSGVLSLRHHPKLRFYGSGYRLSRNAIIVDWTNKLEAPAVPVSAGPHDTDAFTRARQPRPDGLNRHAYHPVAMCRDVRLSVALPEVSTLDQAGRPFLVKGVSTPWRVTVHPEDDLLIGSERKEIVFFLDNQLIYENETSYFPYTWHWSPDGLRPGEHFMTAFVVGFNEHFGFTTQAFTVANEPESASASEQMLEKDRSSVP